ncbi:unnamed protein product [Durusdinium trenchii]|uniref:Uncharacterized protein n=1 Tax=Durusdinium trenchii TaxID=1381693 RepID=A0ABP0HFX0_9DINO
MPTCAVPTEADLDMVVLRLLSVNCPKARLPAFVFIVILTFFNSNMPMVTTPFRVVELFAGDGKLGKTAHYAHMSTAQLDICMGRNSWRRTRKAFDLLTPEGIASTDCMWLAVWTLMNADPGHFMCWIALVCSSFSAVNVHTSRRTPTTPWGDVSKAYVRAGNALASISILLATLRSALGGCFAIEQPRSSRLVTYPRWERFLHLFDARLWWVAWWARHYGALTPKRHICWSNTSQIGRLDRGKLSKAMRESCIVKTTKKVNKNGKITFSGNKFLKQTQPDPIAFGLRVVRCLPHFLRCVAAPPQPKVEMEVPQLFALTDVADTWPEAGLLDACMYLRGSKHLLENLLSN